MRYNDDEKPRQVRLLCGHELIDEDPYVLMSLSTYQKLCCYVDLVDTEINGLGSVKRLGNVFNISDVFLVKQYTRGTVHVEFDSTDFSELVYNVTAAGGTPNFSFQWHSHVWDKAYYSPEDVHTVRQYVDEYMISFVTNKQREYRCRLDLFKPFVMSFEIPLYIVLPEIPVDMIDSCRADIQEKVFSGKFFRREAKTNDKARPIIVPVEQLHGNIGVDERSVKPGDEELFDEDSLDDSTIEIDPELEEEFGLDGIDELLEEAFPNSEDENREGNSLTYKVNLLDLDSDKEGKGGISV
ncbi:hypothetical protein K8R32_05320 [bacterium]|nr:hypothetical protein [bacterium]